jgi:hypothetical protein
MQIDITAYYFRERRARWIRKDVVTDDPGSKPGQRYARRRDRQITFGKLNINLGLRAKSIPIWYKILVHWEGFGLLLAKGCDRIAALTSGKQKHSLKLSAYNNRTAVYA